MSHVLRDCVTVSRSRRFGEPPTVTIHVANDMPLGFETSSIVAVSVSGLGLPANEKCEVASQSAMPWLRLPASPLTQMLCQCDMNTRPPRSAYCLSAFIASCGLDAGYWAPSHDR